MTYGEKALLEHICRVLMLRPDKASETLFLIDEFNSGREFRLAIFALRRSQHPGDDAARMLADMNT